MKKYLTSFAFIVLFGGYVAFEYLANSGSATQPVAVQTQVQPQTDTGAIAAQSAPPPQDSQQENATDGGSDDGSEGQVAQTVQPTTPVPTNSGSTNTSKGKYTDGTYTGSVANAFYGNVQVRATVSGGKLTSVSFLQYPNDRRESQMINQQAMPILINEAIQAQSANVNGVTGASDTSAAFQQSLAAALAQA